MKRFATLVLVDARALVALGAVAATPISAEDIAEGHDRRRCSTSARMAAASRSARGGWHDNAETNHRRYGDPTYVAPSMVEVRVIDTTTGAADRVGSGPDERPDGRVHARRCDGSRC